MKCVTIVYPNKADARFDFDHYLQKHIPMAKALFGQGFRIQRGVQAAAGGTIPFVCLLTIEIESTEKFLSTITGERGAELLADMPNYTNIEPVVQIDEIVA